MMIELLTKIKNKKAKVGIVGMGYVGLSLAQGLTVGGFETIGVDIDEKKVASINEQNCQNLSATADFSKLGGCDIVCICVPTPLDQYMRPNLSIIKAALEQVAKSLKAGMLVIIESSVAAGTCRNFVLPMLQSGKIQNSQLQPDVDLFLACSPERIDPGNKDYNIRNTPKVVGGLGDNSQRLALEFYSNLVQKVVPVSSLEVAEMTKVLENTFRLVNISFINEVAAYTKAMNINIWEVIDAASTKPFGFLTHYPGPGVGGDCIPVLPYYLIDAAERQGLRLPLVEMAAAVNELMPKKVAEKAIEVVGGSQKHNGHAPRVMLVGVSYKADISDMRQSPALKVWDILEKSGMTVIYHDPYIKRINGTKSQKLTEQAISDCDVVIITTAHKKISYKKFLKNGTPVIDTRNIFKNFDHPNIVRMH